MDAQRLGHGPLTEVEKIGGGTQNILMSFRRNGRDYVLRRPPVSKRSNSDETILREAQVLQSLAATQTPHPRFVAACSDQSVLGATFCLMERVNGYNPSSGLPPGIRSDPAGKFRLGLAFVEALAALGKVDPTPLVDAGFGRPERWLERQVGRWRKQLRSYRASASYNDEALGDVERICDWLDSNAPNDWQRGIIHGDYHVGNLLVDYQTHRVAAIVDWELAAIGDPLLDLGHLLATWPRNGFGRPPDPVSAEGMPSDSDLRRHYERCSGRDTTHLGWYRTLACLRMAVILDGTYARSCAGLVPIRVGSAFRSAAMILLDQSRALIAGDYE
jgi:aminoglycoside phosphotransferase (APT) family kinase protein